MSQSEMSSKIVAASRGLASHTAEMIERSELIGPTLLRRHHARGASRLVWHRVDGPRVARGACLNGVADRMKLFLDESGNTGADWLNRDQRFFAHGGWLVPDQGDVTLIFEEIRALVNKGIRELKWKSFAKRSGVLLTPFSDLVLAGCVPVCWVMDKRYVIAAKIVETFLDPEYLDGAPAALTGASRYKKNLAGQVLDASELVNTFSTWWARGEAPGAERLREFALMLAQVFTKNGAIYAAGIVSKATGEGLEAMSNEIEESFSRRSTTAHSIWAILHLANGVLRELSESAEVIHDESREFASEICSPSHLLGQRLESVSGSDGTVLFDGLECLTSLRFEKSENVQALQLADLLCGAARQHFTLASDGRLDEQTRALVALCVSAGRFDGNVR